MRILILDKLKVLDWEDYGLRGEIFYLERYC